MKKVIWELLREPVKFYYDYEMNKMKIINNNSKQWIIINNNK